MKDKKKHLKKKKSSILQEKLALHTGISTFDASILEQLLIATLNAGLSFQSTIFAPFLGFVLIWFDQNNHKICGNTNRG